MFLSQAAARHQIAAPRAGRAGGRQVHLLSVRAQLGMRDRGYSAYCATKGALVDADQAARGRAVGARHHRQRRRADRRARRDGRALARRPGDARAHPARIPLGRVAEPEDVVGATLFFCSPAASFVTGQILYLDGGLTATQ